MINQRTAIIGVGNMGRALVSRLLESGAVDPRKLILTNRSRAKILDLSRQWAVTVTDDNKLAVKKSDIIILCIKPQSFRYLASEIKPSIRKTHLVISVIAGVKISTMVNSFNTKTTPIIRAMPNLGSKYGVGVTGWTAGQSVTLHQRHLVKKILLPLGMEIELDTEEMIDKITAISGSGPAYFLYLSEILEVKAKQLGFSDRAANTIVRQVLNTSAAIAINSPDSLRTLRKAVTSKGGTTQTAIDTLERSGFGRIFMKAVEAAYLRARKLSDLY